MTEAKRSLIQRMMEVRKNVTFITKDADNQGQRFKYASSVAVLSKIREEMNNAGIVMLSEVVGHSTGEIETKSKSIQIVTHLNFAYTLVNVDDADDKITLKWYSQGIDMSEKGPGKAATYGEKYFLLKLFNIPTPNEDPDADPRPEDRDPGTQRQDSSGGVAMASDKQLDFIYTLGEEMWGDQARTEYQNFAAQNQWPTRTDALTKSQASAVIKAMKLENGEDPNQ